MLQKIKREELVKQLVSVMPGLSAQEILEQSSCFVFLTNKVVTFNGDAACWIPCCLKIRGAIQATTLLDILKARPEEILNITPSSKKLIIRGKGQRTTRIAMQTEITLPFREVKEPKKWNTLPSDFLEAINLVYRCCGNDQEHLETFVHIDKNQIEAIGEHQIGHYKTKLHLDGGIIVHKDSIKHVVPLGMTEFGVTRKWIHFRNSADVVLSCHRWPGEEDYPDTNKVVSAKKGKRINLPRGLDKAVSRASIFSRENPEDTDIEIKLQAGKVLCKGEGIQGDHRESRKVQYSGKNLTFTISPTLLTDLCRKHTEAWITPTTLTVKSGNFTFITTLGVEDDNSIESEE